MIINEPTAAAIYYANQKNMQPNDRPVLCLVFDFGGGTLDISVVEVGPGNVRVKTSHGDHNCGGQDIDNELMKWLL